MSAPIRTPAWIRVLVHGLFVCAVKQNDGEKPSLEIAALKNPSPGHRLSLEVWNRDTTQAPDEITGLTEETLVRLEVSEPNGVTQYQQQEEFEYNENDDRSDFRWLIDFEAEELFGTACGHRNTGFKFSVNDGMAFTLVRSAPLRRSTNNGPPEEWRRVALVIAVDIDYTAGRLARLVVPNREAIELSPLNRYNVVLRNDCPSGNCGPTTTPDRPVVDPTELFQTVVPPAGSPEFTIFNTSLPDWIAELILDKEVLEIGGIAGPPEKQLRGLWRIFQPKGSLRGRDSKLSPCGPAYRSKSNGFG